MIIGTRLDIDERWVSVDLVLLDHWTIFIFVDNQELDLVRPVCGLHDLGELVPGILEPFTVVAHLHEEVHEHVFFGEG